jgi:hypothetical protein
MLSFIKSGYNLTIIDSVTSHKQGIVLPIVHWSIDETDQIFSINNHYNDPIIKINYANDVNATTFPTFQSLIDYFATSNNIIASPLRADYLSPLHFNATYSTASALIISSLRAVNQIYSSTQIVYVKVIRADYSSHATYINLSNCIITYTSGVLQIIQNGAVISPFISTDIIEVGINGLHIAYDIGNDVQKTYVDNLHRVHVANTIIIDANITIATSYFKMLRPGSRNNIDIQAIATSASGTANIKVHKTLNPLATAPATGGTPDSDWYDVTSAIFGGALSSASINELKSHNNASPYAYLFEWNASTATNTFNIWANIY